MKITKKSNLSNPLDSRWICIALMIGLFTFAWLLSVVKVFLIESATYVQIQANYHSNTLKDQQIKLYPKPTSRKITTNEDILQNVQIPRSENWNYREIRRKRENLFVTANNAEDNAPVHPIQIPEHALKQTLEWPPVMEDGSIPPDEGTDSMVLTGLKVPRFWSPPPDKPLESIGTKVNGEETIFLMIASYRDFQCHETITSAFLNADHPERLFVGAVDQFVPGDVRCIDTEKPCEEDPNQMICKYRSQISIYNMDAQMATGPVPARHIGDRMYRGQYYVMQMDAHCQFVKHWDTLIINQWKETKNEMAVLSSYLSDVQGSIKDGKSTRNTRPIMCNSDFEGSLPARYLRHGSQPEDYAVIRDMPQLQPYWAAGFSFSRGHFVVRVPYDGLQPMVFQGEEISIGIRGFTHGYDFYAPRDSVVFHEYAEKSNRRKKIHMFWENSGKHVGEGVKALKRSMSIIKMAPDIDPKEWDHTDEEKYGIGNVRPLELFYKLFLIDTKTRKATQLCPFVKSGKMHIDFQKYLRPDGKGIDYSHLLNYDTTKALDEILSRQRGPAEEMLKQAIKGRDIGNLEFYLDNARRTHLDQFKPDLYSEGAKLLAELRKNKQ